MNLFDLLANDPNLADGFKRNFKRIFGVDPTERSETKPEAVGDDRAEPVADARSDDVKPKRYRWSSVFTLVPPDGTDWDQLAQDDRDTFDARLDSMPEPLGGDDE